MPSSALGTRVRIRRNVPEIGNIILRADEGIGPYKGGAFIHQIPICCAAGKTDTINILYLVSHILYLTSPLSCRGDFFAPALAARRFDCFIFWDVVEFFHGDSLSSLPAGASPVNVCWRRPSPITKERQ